MKVCRSCNVEKGADQFNRSSQRKDGLRSYCRACEKSKYELYKATEPAKRLAAQRSKRYRSTANGEARRRAYRASDLGRDSDRRYARSKYASAEGRKKVLARHKVMYAIKTGKLTRKPCEVCGSSLAEAHHENYDRPLEVRFLCRSHHAQHHEVTA
jgi:hypothetical protein